MKALIDQLIIGTHENIRTTYIGRQALVETPIILSATRFAGFSTAGWLPGFPAAFFNASPTAFIAGASTSASGFVDSPTYAWGSTPLWRNRWF